jgi:coenzyme F420-reducing hydrogenase delta subunit/DNA-binding transcriptional ArsR family regulator
MADTFRPKIFAFSCKRSSLQEAQNTVVPIAHEDAEIDLTLLECSGKLELINLVEPFLKGADGIFSSGCLSGECHFKNGNLQAESKVILGKNILKHSSVNPERLLFVNLPSGGNEQFNQSIKGFINTIKSFGPLGSSENVGEEIVQLKLQAAMQSVNGKKLNWVISRRYQFMEKGNRYGEIFTNHEMNRMLDDIAMDECRLQQISLLLQKEPHSALDIAEKLSISPPQILLHLTDLKRMGKAEIAQVKGNTPLWQASAVN